MMLRKLFIGGLFPEVKEEQLRQRFSTYGTISDIEIKTKNDESGTILTGLQIYGGPGSLSHDFKIWPITKAVGPVDPSFLVVKISK